MAGFCREDILMEDNDILVVHKHAGMAVQNARMGQMDLEHALLNYLAKQTRAETPGQARTQIPYLAVVHRLDQPVEGVLVFAKNKDAAGKLGRQFHSDAGYGRVVGTDCRSGRSEVRCHRARECQLYHACFHVGFSGGRGPYTAHGHCADYGDYGAF